MKETVQIPVSNMSCAVCASRVEKALGQLPGVDQATVNFATDQATVSRDPSVTTDELVGAVLCGAEEDLLLISGGCGLAPLRSL